MIFYPGSYSVLYIVIVPLCFIYLSCSCMCLSLSLPMKCIVYCSLFCIHLMLKEMHGMFPVCTVHYAKYFDIFKIFFFPSLSLALFIHLNIIMVQDVLLNLFCHVPSQWGSQFHERFCTLYDSVNTHYARAKHPSPSFSLALFQPLHLFLSHE